MIMTITIVTFLASFFPLFTMRKAFVCAVPNQVGSDMSKWRASKYEHHRSHPSLRLLIYPLQLVTQTVSNCNDPITQTIMAHTSYLEA